MATQDPTTSQRAPLKRSLGMWVATALVVGNMIGSGVFWMIYGAGEETVAKGFLLLAAGIPVYVWLKWQERRSGDAGTPAVLGDAPAPAPRELAEAGRGA